MSSALAICFSRVQTTIHHRWCEEILSRRLKPKRHNLPHNRLKSQHKHIRTLLRNNTLSCFSSSSNYCSNSFCYRTITLHRSSQRRL